MSDMEPSDGEDEGQPGMGGAYESWADGLGSGEEDEGFEDDDEDVSDDFEDEDVSDEDVSDDESSRRRFVAIGLLFLVLQSRRSSRNDVNDDACKSFSFRGRTRDDGRLFMPTLRTTLRTTTTGW